MFASPSRVLAARSAYCRSVRNIPMVDETRSLHSCFRQGSGFRGSQGFRQVCIGDSARRIASYDRVGCNITHYDRACGNHRSFADSDAGVDDSPLPNPDVVADSDRLHRFRRCCCALTAKTGGSGVSRSVKDNHLVRNQAVLPDRDTFANPKMRVVSY